LNQAGGSTKSYRLGISMSRNDVQVARLRPRDAEAASDAGLKSGAARIGRVVAFAADGTLTVSLPDRPNPVPARLAVSVARARLERAIEERQEVVVLFEAGGPERALVVGFIEPLQPDSSPAPRVIEADVDGKRVRVVGQDEIVLECGNASITLRRNGRVVIRGTYVETHSDGTNRIKGGQVRIN
jgi:hypothetical protein